MPYYVYLLASRRNGTLYLGFTNDLVRRVHEHKWREGNGYPIDMRDAEWAWLAPLIPEARRVGDRARPTCARRRTPSSICCAPAALSAICPATAFRRARPSTTSFASSNVMASRGRSGLALRERMGREASPSAAVLDSQSVKSAERGRYAGKRVKGGKIHALVDSEGLPMRVVVHSAAIQDRDGAGLVLDKIRRRFPWLGLIWADGGYNAWLKLRWQRCRGSV